MIAASTEALGVAIGVAAVASGVIRSAAAPRQRRGRWQKLLAGFRLVLGTGLVLLLVLPVVHAANGLPIPLRWAVWSVAGALLAAGLVNCLAGLWLLSPLVGAAPGRVLVTSGLRGRIRRYGWFRLEVSTRTGWSAHLPYWSIARQPLIVSREDGPRSVVLTLRRERWLARELQYLRQAAILCPYRDASVAVSLSCNDRVANVRLALARQASKDHLRRYLERALAEYRDRVQPGENGAADGST